jgi:hypothetical protein
VCVGVWGGGVGRLAATAAPALVPQRPDRPRPKRPCHRLQNHHIGSDYHRFSLPNGSVGNAAGKEMTTHVAEVFQPQTPSWRHIRQLQHLIDLQYTQVVRQVAVASATSRATDDNSTVRDGDSNVREACADAFASLARSYCAVIPGVSSKPTDGGSPGSAGSRLSPFLRVFDSLSAKRRASRRRSALHCVWRA